MEIYILNKQQLGKVGKKVILNRNSDMPVEKFLYKLPKGNYIVTTNFKKIANFFVVKDNPINTNANKYPEELNYVSEGYLITNGKDDLNGKAQKSINVFVKEDESIQIVGEETLIFKRIS